PDPPRKGRRRPARPLALRRLHGRAEGPRDGPRGEDRRLPARVAVRPPDRRLAAPERRPPPGAFPGVQRLRRSDFARADDAPAPARRRASRGPAGARPGRRGRSRNRQPISGEMMAYRIAESELIARRSAASIAGGVVSLNRKVDPAIVFPRARGSRLWDA